MKIESEIITIFLSMSLAVIGLITYILTDHIFTPIWLASFVALIATVLIDVINRVEFL